MDDVTTGADGLTVAGITARPGEKVRRWVKLTEDASGPLNLPYIVIAGRRPGTTLYVNSGLHGDEYDGLEAALRIADEVDPATLAGNLVICPRVNIPAWNHGFRFSEIDGLDLNRVFPGRPDGFLAEQIAHFVSTRVLPHVDVAIDLHGGTTQLEVVSYGGWQSVDALDVKPAAVRMGMRHFFDWSQTLAKRPTFMRTAATLGIPTLVCEIGGGNRWSEASAMDGVRAVRNTMRYFGMIGGAFENTPDEVLVLRGPLSSSPAGGFLRPRVKLGEWVRQGQVLAEIVNLLGEKVCDVTAEFDGVVNDARTMPRIRPGEWLYMIGKIEERVPVGPAPVERKPGWRRRRG